MGVGLAGAPDAVRVHGRDFVPSVEDPDTAPRHAACPTVGMPDPRHLHLLDQPFAHELVRPPPSSSTSPAHDPVRQGGPDLAAWLELFGAGEMSDADLLALVLRGCAPTVVATRLLEQLGGLAGLSAASVPDLKRARGVGPVTAASVVAAVELARRLARSARDWEAPLRRPADVAEYMRVQLRGLPQEHFLILGLDARQRVILQRTVAVGSLARVDVHPRELFRPLVRQGAHAALMVHNHPSGDPQPSDADIELTRRMVEVGKLLGITILDHLVVSDTGSVSLASLGLV